MAAQLRELKRRISSTQSFKRIFRAQELIATSRISKAQDQVNAARPYSEEITNVMSALATNAAAEHPVLKPREHPARAGMLVVTSDRGLCGAYNANVLRKAEELQSQIAAEGKEPSIYVIGRNGLGYYSFRQRQVAASWTGFSERPGYPSAKEVASPLVRAFRAGSEEDESARERYLVEEEQPLRLDGVDELHIVYTQFNSMLSQSVVARRLAPLDVEYASADGTETQYEFEPDPDTLFHSLVPKYLATRIYSALLESAASESAMRRRAMKAATDNADELIRDLTLKANRARQAQITQEISEIVGGVEALAGAGSDD